MKKNQVAFLELKNNNSQVKIVSHDFNNISHKAEEKSVNLET